MSLQKSLPLNQHSNRRQLPERRRTLQTISELSAIDGSSSQTKTHSRSEHTGRPSNASSTATNRVAPNLRRRQSVPGYCSNPGCLHAQAAYVRESMRYSQSKQTAHIANANMHQVYNVAEENVRLPREHHRLDGKGLIGNQHMSDRARFPAKQTSLRYLRPYASQPQLSHDGFSRTLEARAHAGSFSRHVYENNLPGRVNTNSSPYNVHGEAVPQRSRYGTLNPSVPYHTARPMPNQGYYPTPAAFHNQVVSWKSATPVNSRKVAVRRSSSLPAIRVGHVGEMPYKNRQAMPRSFKLPDEEPVLDVHGARLAALAALTGSDVRSLQKKRTGSPSIMTVPVYGSSSSLRQRKRPSTRSRTRFSPNVRVVPLNDNIKSKSSDSLVHHDGTKRSRVCASLEGVGAASRKKSGKRPVDRRETRRTSDAMRRAEVADRVKWANERERERAKELELLRKGSKAESGSETSEEGQKKRGCLRGVLAVFSWKNKG